ncbi:MAG TPA: transposase, partial [Candidatus Hydrogenedentes bacterium]|nr:transposase [Candidatus Hydrogenedentota bacterium]
MPRTARVVIPGAPHHVTQRGNNRQQVFFEDADYDKYLRLLHEQSRKYGLTIHSYCLMPNHVHLVATPATEEGLANAVGRTHSFYARYFNWRRNQSGHLWQGRFFCCVLDEPHTMAAMLYTERNPVRAGLVQRAWDHPWSSAHAHVNVTDPWGLLEWGLWGNLFLGGGDTWAELLQDGSR